MRNTREKKQKEYLISLFWRFVKPFIYLFIYLRGNLQDRFFLTVEGLFCELDLKHYSETELAELYILTLVSKDSALENVTTDGLR